VCAKLPANWRGLLTQRELYVGSSSGQQGVELEITLVCVFGSLYRSRPTKTTGPMSAPRAFHLERRPRLCEKSHGPERRSSPYALRIVRGVRRAPAVESPSRPF
jgi:hypothetical protein